METYEFNGYIALLTTILQGIDTVTAFKNLGVDLTEKRSCFWTEYQLQQLRDLVLAGYKNREISKIMGYSPTQIHNQKAYLRRTGRLEKVEEIEKMQKFKYS